MAEIVAPRDASTILLLRDSKAVKVDGKSRDEIEVFMMVRHYEIDFNSGALVFPGGSVDKNDKEIIVRPELYTGGEGLDTAALSFRIAAIRETFEESGILLARPKGSKALVDAKRAGEIEAAHRADLNEGKITFLKVLTDNRLVLALDGSCPTRTGSRRKVCRNASTPGSSSPLRRRTSSAPMTARNPPIRSGCRRARRLRVARTDVSSCRSRPRAT